jgi:hypothetical protein
VTLDDEYEKRLQDTISLINSGKKPEKNVEEVTETFQNITGKIHELASALFTGDLLDSTSLAVEDDYSKYFPEDTAENVITPVSPADNVVDTLQRDIDACWSMAEVFMRNRDAHGIHDMGVEIQALERTLREIKKLRGNI